MKTTSRVVSIFLTLAGIALSGNVFATVQPFNQAPVAIITEGQSDLIAEPGGQLRVYVGHSYDPDPSDAISHFSLDLDMDGFFHDMDSFFPLLEWFDVPYGVLTGTLHALGAGTHDLRLMVTDMNGAVAFDTASFTILSAVAPPVTVPEPQTWGLALAGFGALWATRRRHGTAAAGRI